MAERAVTIARRLVAKKQRMVEAKAKAEQAEKDYKAVERDFWELMLDENRTSDTLDLGEPYGRVQFTRRETIRGNVIDKDAAIAALREQGLDEALVDTKIRQGALNDLTRRWVRTGEFPAGLDFSSTKYITVTPKKRDREED